jgi:hypothetical protein
MENLNRYFEILEIEPGTSFDKVKNVYRDLVKVWHPDRFSHDPHLQLKAQEKLKQIVMAYKSLENYYAKYDYNPPPLVDINFQDSYEDLYGHQGTKETRNHDYSQGRSISALPKIWIGFIFAGALLFAEFIELTKGNEESISSLIFIVGLSGIVYWLFCVHRFHKLIAELSTIKYPISPAAAVGYHFIPFFNLYWVFKWPIEFSKFINAQRFVQMASGGSLGFLLLISLILYRTVDGALGLACIFGISAYMASKLRKKINMKKSQIGLKLCPSCNVTQNATKKECPNCGYDLTNVEIYT